MKYKASCGTVFQIDDSDYDLCENHNFWIHPIKYNGSVIKKYVRFFLNGKNTFLHRFLINAPKELHVDHKDGDGLNNRRCNLRLCNSSQNGANSKIITPKTSIFKGVCIDAKKRSIHIYKAQITKNGKTKTIGRFANEMEAAKAYDIWAKKLHGEFAKTNKELGLL